MLITKEWLKEKSACKEGCEWSIPMLKEPMEDKAFLKALIKDNKLDWAHWFIVRIFNKPDKVRYAIFAAEQVIHLYEKKYPKDERPRKAIEAAKKVLENDTKENRTFSYADAAASAAYAAASASAASAAYAAAYAAYTAAASADADAAYTAAYAAYAASDDADAADAYASADAARKQMQLKILNYGIGLLDRELAGLEGK